MSYVNNETFNTTIQHRETLSGHRTTIGRKAICTLLGLTAVIITGGCSSLAYYSQSIAGQFEISSKQRPIDEVLQDSAVSAETRRQLTLVQQIRTFASEQLGLPDNDSYRDYADLNRDYVVWNLFAAPELSLEPHEWCYLLVGCFNYRGYFSREDTLQHANVLREQGLDVFTGGVAAYSTLGWFDDPVLNTMLHWDDPQLAAVIFHELAHQQIFIRNDTRFNEAFADTVALIGVRRWLREHGTARQWQRYEISRQQEEDFLSLVFHYRDKLDKIYQSEWPDERKRADKSRLLTAMKRDYKILSRDWDRPDRYADWLDQVNNASLLAVITYRDYLPGFMALLEYTGNNLPDFYKLVARLGQCPEQERRQILEQQQTAFEC